MSTFMMPLRRAMSLPTLMGQMESGPVGEVRVAGIDNIELRALSHRVLEKGAATGWASVMLDPMTKNILAFSKSAKELVIAPEPNVVARPATVGACQVRAQLSMLLVPITARKSFCIW